MLRYILLRLLGIIGVIWIIGTMLAGTVIALFFAEPIIKYIVAPGLTGEQQDVAAGAEEGLQDGSPAGGDPPATGSQQPEDGLSLFPYGHG